MEEMTGLDFKRAAFVLHYSVNRDPRDAAEHAGFRAEYGYKLLAEPLVQAALDRVLENFYKEAQVDAEWVLAEYKDLYFRTREKGENSNAIKCLDGISKNRLVDSLATSRTDINLTTDEELIARITRGRRRVSEEAKQADTPSDSESGLSFL